MSLCESISLLGFGSDSEEEENDELAALANQLSSPSPGSLRQLSRRSPKPPTPPLYKRTGRTRRSPRHNLLNDLQQEARPRTPIFNASNISEQGDDESLLTQVLGPAPPEVKRLRGIDTFFELQGIRNPKSYFETTLTKAIDRELDRHAPAIARVGLGPEGLLWTALGVAHCITVAAAGYQGRVLEQPGRHPHTGANKWGQGTPRDIPISELIVVLSRNSVQLYEKLLYGIIPQPLNGEYGTYDEEKNLPRSDFQVCPSHLIVVISFLAHIGVVHTKCGYQAPRASVTQDPTSLYGHRLSELFYIANTQPFTGPYASISVNRTLFFTVVGNYDYAWYYLLRNVLNRCVKSTYANAGFHEFAIEDDLFRYHWDWDSEAKYWCPVLADGYEPEVTRQPGVLY